VSPPLLRAVVLRTRPYSETSLWVRLYSESHGKITGISKGARRGTERHYSSLIEVEAKGYPPRAAESGLWNLTRPEILRDWRDLASDPDRMAWAFSLLELIDELVGDHQAQPDLYYALSDCLQLLSDAKGTGGESVLLWFVLRLCDELGYSFQHDICPGCENPLIFPVGALVNASGGILCQRCSPPEGTPLDQKSWEVLVDLAASPSPSAREIPPAVRSRLLTLLVDYLSYHSERRLRLDSLQLLGDFGNKQTPR
jgi:DNA repair protein RecO (recombination protein O)